MKITAISVIIHELLLITYINNRYKTTTTHLYIERRWVVVGSIKIAFYSHIDTTYFSITDLKSRQCSEAL